MNKCGVSFIGSSGIEWTCIKDVHDVGYDRKTNKKKGAAYGTGGSRERAPTSEQHYFVRKYPNQNLT